MQPQFWYPERVITPHSQDAFMALLDEYHVPYATWVDKDQKIKDLWGEIASNDAVYISGEAWGQPELLVRFIITVAARITVRARADDKSHLFVLIEYVSDGEYYRPRKHLDTSGSEKVKLTPDGRKKEKPISTIYRLLREESGINTPLEVIRRGSVFRPWVANGLVPDRPSPMAQFMRYIESDFHEKEKLPGLWHHNQIARYHTHLPRRFHFLGWFKEATKKYLSRFRSSNEPSSALDPIPVDVIELLP